MRTSNKNIAACFLLLEAHGVDTKVPISTAVDLALTALLQGREELVMSDIFKKDEHEAALIVNSYTDKPKLELSPAPLAFPPVDSEGSAAATNAMPVSVDKAAIDRAVGRVKSGGIRAEAPDELPAVPKDAPPWEEFPRLIYGNLKQAYPKDAMIERADKDEMMQRAIEVIYKAVPNTQWHTPKTVEMVMGLTKSFKLWQGDEKPLDI